MCTGWSMGGDRMSERLRVVPASREAVAAFVQRVHRHHRPSPGDVFRLAVVDDGGNVRGVAQVGRPVARMADDGWTLEVNRVATDGARNACSMLYGAARRVAWTMGYRRILTYTLPEEGGASLRAAGWTCDGAAGGGLWTRADRPRHDERNTSSKLRWSCENPDAHGGMVTWPVDDDDAQATLFGPLPHRESPG